MRIQNRLRSVTMGVHLVNEFSGEDPECLLDDWLPSLNRASLWNGWSEEEQMIQLAGHLKG